MKIYLKESEGRSFRIIIPSGLMCSRLSARIIAYAAKDKGLSYESVQGLFQALRQCRKRYPGLEIVHVESADGDMVRIWL